jgi:hypothetical protein
VGFLGFCLFFLLASLGPETSGASRTRSFADQTIADRTFADEIQTIADQTFAD